MTASAEPGRRERKRAQTLDHLAATAFALFEANGFDAVTMEQIAAAADVAKGTLYNHFPVKEALLAHQFHNEFAASRIDLRAQVDAAPTFAARLGVVLEASARWCRARRPYLPHYFRYRMGGETARSGIETAYAMLIAAGQHSGEVRSDLAPEHLAMLLKQLYFGALLRWLCQPDLDLNAEFATVIDLFLNGAAAGRQP